DVVRRCLASFLLECVKDIDSLRKSGNIDQAVLPFPVHSNLTNSHADRGHGLPIRWLPAALDFDKLKSSLAPCFARKADQIVIRRPYPRHRFQLFGHDTSFCIFRNVPLLPPLFLPLSQQVKRLDRREGVEAGAGERLAKLLGGVKEKG